MSGPPTPPPTSAIELEDAARTSVPSHAPQTTVSEPAVAAQRPPGPPAAQQPSVASQATTFMSNSYRQLFPAIRDLASNERFEELAEAAELGDLTVRPLAS